MKKHIPFHKLSDLYDGKIRSRSERTALLEHVESCGRCREDYEKLQAMIEMVQGMTAYRIRERSFIAETMEKVRLRYSARRKRFVRYTALSATAAGLVLAISVGMYSVVRDVERNDILKKISALEAEYRTEQNRSPRNYDIMKTDFDKERVLSILQRNKARVYDVYEKHVEGEVGLSSLSQLKRELAERSLRERPGRKTGPADRIEEGSGYDVIPEREWTSLIDAEPVIKFRVNLK